MNKSSRHSKITGDFGEALILYWLSKQGFECARVDHTGIDILATEPKSRQRWGISVKSRSRAPGTEDSYLGVPCADFTKVEAACEAFGCRPYFGIVVDKGPKVYAFVLPMDYFKSIAPPGRRVSAWQMTPRHVQRYQADPTILSFELLNGGRW